MTVASEDRVTSRPHRVPALNILTHGPLSQPPPHPILRLADLRSLKCVSHSILAPTPCHRAGAITEAGKGRSHWPLFVPGCKQCAVDEGGAAPKSKGLRAGSTCLVAEHACLLRAQTQPISHQRQLPHPPVSRTPWQLHPLSTVLMDLSCPRVRRALQLLPLGLLLPRTKAQGSRVTVSLRHRPF